MESWEARGGRQEFGGRDEGGRDEGGRGDIFVPLSKLCIIFISIKGKLRDVKLQLAIKGW